MSFFALLALVLPISADRTDCASRFEAPAKPGRVVTEHNGVALQDVCMPSNSTRHVFIIGDWGGVRYEENLDVMPADHRSHLFPTYARAFVDYVDNCAQQRVAGQMSRWAEVLEPDYILNMGDNFYWGGVSSHCGEAASKFEEEDGFRWQQWGPIFEEMYRGKGIDGKQWLGVLGNHDYGGYIFTGGWDENIRYTWHDGRYAPSRWMTPAQYWQVKVWYGDFSVDYYFVDTNVYNVWGPDIEMNHNICSGLHNRIDSTCDYTGPTDLAHCQSWFRGLWETEQAWLEDRLGASSADWQIVVSHFPGEYDPGFWGPLCQRHGVDLMVSGHRHFQQLTGASDPGNLVGGTPYIISGGGGGITSDKDPELFGDDDAYGFMDLELSKKVIKATAVSHGGKIRKQIDVLPRVPEGLAQFV